MRSVRDEVGQPNDIIAEDTYSAKLPCERLVDVAVKDGCLWPVISKVGVVYSAGLGFEVRGSIADWPLEYKGEEA